MDNVRIGELTLRSPILVAALGKGANEIVAAAPRDCMLLTPGAGLAANLPVPPANAPPLQPPAPDSLVAHLTANSNGIRGVGTIVLDAGDDISLSLMRGRLTPGQILMLAGASDNTSDRAAELGDPQLRQGIYSVYSNFPIPWLDPLDSRGRPHEWVFDPRAWPKISVVMVSFNQAEFLEEGLRSVLDQGYPNLEFIVVDGASKDNSVEILERYRSRLSTLVIEPDKGQSDGLNKGFARATGDILTWVNSDDLLEPGALFRVAQAFLAHKTDMVVGGCRQIGRSRSRVIRNHHALLPFGYPLPLPLGLLLEMDRFWLNGCFFYQPEVFFSRDIWNRSGGALRTDLNYVLDYDLCVRMAAAGATIVHIPDFLACSRTHDQQKTTIGMPYLPEVQRLLRQYAASLLAPPPRGP